MKQKLTRMFLLFGFLSLIMGSVSSAHCLDNRWLQLDKFCRDNDITKLNLSKCCPLRGISL